MLPGHLLASKGDRIAMHSSVERRYAFLDEDVIAYMAKLHPRWKLRGMLKDKFIERKVAERWLPKEVAWRRKHMFRAPMDTWARVGEPAAGSIRCSRPSRSARRATSTRSRSQAAREKLAAARPRPRPHQPGDGPDRRDRHAIVAPPVYQRRPVRICKSEIRNPNAEDPNPCISLLSRRRFPFRIPSFVFRVLEYVLRPTNPLARTSPLRLRRAGGDVLGRADRAPVRTAARALQDHVDPDRQHHGRSLDRLHGRPERRSRQADPELVHHAGRGPSRRRHARAIHRQLRELHEASRRDRTLLPARQRSRRRRGRRRDRAHQGTAHCPDHAVRDHRGRVGLEAARARPVGNRQ